MRSLRILAALVLALLWLPATLHCGLETAGIFGHADACCHHEDNAADPAAACGQDACDLVEGGDYQPSQNTLKAPAPVLLTEVLFLIEIVTASLPPTQILAATEVESPPEFRRTWHIVSRAAPLPGAPSLSAA